MKEIRIDEIRYRCERSKFAGDVLIVRKCIRDEEPVFLFCCHGDEWRPDRYKAVLQAFLQIKKEKMNFLLYMKVPENLKKELKAYGGEIGIQDAVIYPDKSEENILPEKDMILEIEVPNTLKKVFLLGKPAKIISGDVLSLWNAVKKVIEKVNHETQR